MKKIFSLTSLLILLLTVCSCNSRNNVPKKDISRSSSTTAVNVYYFHFTKRCATCLAVEENARKSVEELYPQEVKTGDYSFTSLNLDEADAKEIADKLGVGGQTLLVVHGDKKIDITSDAWFAAHDPEKMKNQIKSGIEKVMF